MRVTILCEDKWIKGVREKAETVLGKHLALTTPVSKTGKEPATHWLCVCDLTNEGWEKLLEVKKHSIMTQSSPKNVLSELDLKIIK